MHRRNLPYPAGTLIYLFSALVSCGFQGSKNLTGEKAMSEFETTDPNETVSEGQDQAENLDPNPEPETGSTEDAE
jgi:hypothetical protein